jgi:hypothetical protein
MAKIKDGYQPIPNKLEPGYQPAPDNGSSPGKTPPAGFGSSIQHPVKTETSPKK